MRIRSDSGHAFAVALSVLALIALAVVAERVAGAQPRQDAVPATGGSHREPPAVAAPGSCGQCHADVSKHDVVHPKLADCASCHVQAAGQAHRFTAKACVTCHEVTTPKDKFVHGPVAAGDCLACHSPHGAAEPQLVRAVGADLCQTCHVDMKATLAEKRFVHDPVKEDCTTCHSPHASQVKYQIRDASASQCLACHKTMRKQLVTAAVQHEAITQERQCINCHDPHASDVDGQLRGSSMDLCLKCHDRELEAPSGTIQDIKGWLEAHTNLHGPIRQQDCVGCHDPHQSEHFRLLRRQYPGKFYSAFDPKNYELCFMCHEPDLATVEKTRTLTAFRNGDRNLHFVHVNQAEKGRTCRACHEAHSSNSPKHLRETVPFGTWQLPIGFSPSGEGGNCTTGCHVPLAYDRMKPVVYDTATKK